jgi:hypothetical protein
MNIQNCACLPVWLQAYKKALTKFIFPFVTKQAHVKGIKFHRSTFPIASLLFKVLWLFLKSQNGSAHHKQPKSAIMFCVERFKIWTATINEPFGFNNRFNSFIWLSKLGMFQNVPHTNHVKTGFVIRLYLPQIDFFFFYFAFISWLHPMVCQPFCFATDKITGSCANI